jgi:hypothetical protein
MVAEDKSDRDLTERDWIAFVKPACRYLSLASALALRGLEDRLSRGRLLRVFHQKLTHCDGNLLQVSLKREMSRWQEFDSSGRDVFLFCSRRVAG